MQNGGDKEMIQGLISEKMSYVYEKEDLLPHVDLIKIDQSLDIILNHHTCLYDPKENTFLLSFMIPQLFYNKQGVYTPEWGHNLKGDQRDLDILSELYKIMLDKDYSIHTISDFLVRDLDDFMFHNAYGSRCLDAHMSMTTSEKHKMIRPACEKDLHTIEALIKEHHEEMNAPPILLGHDFESPKSLAESWLKESDTCIYLYKDLAMLKTVKGKSGGCDLASNPQTLGIQLTQVNKNARHQGIASALLKHAIAIADEEGFEHIAVDYESCNPYANHFWPKYFKVTIRSYIRHLF